MVIYPENCSYAVFISQLVRFCGIYSLFEGFINDVGNLEIMHARI